MHKMLIEQLNTEYGMPGLQFEFGKGGLVKAAVHTSVATGEIYLHGAHVTRWQPAGHREVLWVSGSSWFEAGKPIRGGVPICFPWFGAHPTDALLPAHGTARISQWQVTATSLTAAGSVQLSFEYVTESFLVQYTVEFGPTLRMCLQVTLAASSAKVVQFEEALHSYFAVSDVQQIVIEGLESAPFIDKMDGAAVTSATGRPIRFSGETDRVYFDTDATCTLRDWASARRIVISKSGSLSTVVWNPWTAKAARMPDFGDNDWPGMVCIETANVAGNAIELEPGDSHSMHVEVAVNT